MAPVSRHGLRAGLPAARPPVLPDGPVTVGALLRREGRAAHSHDRPVVPRARDLAGDGQRGHRTAVAAGALLAVTAVLGTNVVGGIALGPAPDDGGPGAVPPPTGGLSLAATGSPLQHAMAALRAAGTPVQAALDAPATGGGIAARLLAPAAFTSAVPGDTATDTTSATDDAASGGGSTGSSRSADDDRPDSRPSSADRSSDDADRDRADPPRVRVPPVLGGTGGAVARPPAPAPPVMRPAPTPAAPDVTDPGPTDPGDAGGTPAPDPDPAAGGDSPSGGPATDPAAKPAPSTGEEPAADGSASGDGPAADGASGAAADGASSEGAQGEASSGSASGTAADGPADTSSA